ncbi:DUF4368 domain-containing protein, partial [Neglectibacter timonensis]
RSVHFSHHREQMNAAFLFATKGGIREMAVFRVEKNSGYTVMSNHHLRNRALSLKAKGLLSQMLSLPEDWDYTLQGLARINRESIDAIRQAIRELEQAGYIQRSRERDEKGRLRGADYVIFELPQPVPASVSPTLENPTLENPTQENPTLENPMQLNKDKLITEKQKKEGLNTDSIPIHSPNPLPLDEDEAAAPPPERTGSRKETAYQKEGILTPQAYWIQKGIGRPGKTKTRPATKWNGSTITHLLYQQEYCGDVLNFKTYSKSYKNKKRIHNDPENWVVFQNVHEPIIERAVFEQVQQKRGKMRKRRTSNGEHNMFSGLLVCADCGCNLHFHFNQGNPEIKYFNCSNYKGNRGTCQSTHYIRVDFLEEVVLGEIRRLTKFASLYEDDFLKAVIGHSQQADETDRKLKEKELKALLARDEELDGLFERIYEDNVSGKISDERFSRMSRRYEDEQKELTEKIKQLRSEIEKQSSRTMTTDMFISLVRKYTRAKKLTPRMLNELVEKIEVFNAEKVNGVWEQRLRIHYNCVGTIEIPSALPLPTPDVSVNTRKGVVVNYAPCDAAI